MQNFPDASADKKNYRIFCDCEGTLYGLANGDRYNIALIEFLMEAQKNGYEVQIFSNDPEGSSLNLQMAVYFLQRERPDLADFLKTVEINHKNMHRGDEAAMIFDDDHSTHEAISDNFLAPDDSRIVEMTRELKSSNAQGTKLTLSGLDHK